MSARDLSQQEIKVFVPTRSWFLFGGRGWLGGLYVGLYSAQIITLWLSFAPREELDPQIAWRLCVLAFLGGAFLFAAWFRMIVVTNEVLVYRWFRTRVILWKDVARVRIEARTGEIIIATNTAKLRIDHLFPLRRLIPLVLDMAKRNSPNCDVKDERGTKSNRRIEAAGE